MVPLSVLLDTSVVVPLFLPDVFVERARAFLLSESPAVIISDLVATEFASVVGIRLRAGLLDKAAARMVFSNFDVWMERKAIQAAVQPSDFRDAQSMLRRLDLVLRAPDAIHLAVTRRMESKLATFDKQMAGAARALGIPIVKV